ncbi:MAG TPA: LysR family transcriptional regulator [Ferrovibrio sp.]|jgi:DNA-binding transcriptional LysR family regulator|uniref:LysR family transcriptional regulator n=1 Tax=Ferrovibrio sp. TaxID=1917215 RepID=UPI002ECFB531
MTAKTHRGERQPQARDPLGRIAWDDLRIVLAVATAGSLAGGARRLGVNHTTVLRRIAAAEERLGLRLFERQPGGYMLTAGGEEWVKAARGIDETVTALERRLAGQDLRLSGSIRLTTTDTLMASVLPKILAEFRAAHPGIQIEAAVSNAMFSLTRREADVAIRPTTIARWLRQTLPDVTAAAFADSFVTLRDLAVAGIGLTALPCYLGDSTPGLLRFGAPQAGMQTALWLLTHEDLRRSARIRAFTDFVARALVGRRPLLEGRGRR